MIPLSVSIELFLSQSLYHNIVMIIHLQINKEKTDSGKYQPEPAKKGRDMRIYEKQKPIFCIFLADIYTISGKYD